MMMWRPRLPSPFGTAFLGVPTAVQLILHDLGFAPVQSDGEILVACCLEWVKKDQVANPDAGVFDPRPWTRIVGIAPDGNHVLVASDTYNLILARILGSQPQPLEEADLELATKTLQQLLFRAAGARQSHTYSPLEMEQAIRDREEWILSGSIEAPDVLAVANKWRHWKPGKIQTQLPTSQRALEQHLRARWLERLLGYFIPFRHQIPYMHQVMGAKELEEFGHLFGDARFRAIRAHCLAYEGMRKIGFQNLPWTAGDVRHLMNQAVTLEVTPAKLQKWWGTLKWLSIKLGMLNVDEHKQLLAKRKAIQETLVDTQVKPQRKAVVPTRAIVWALEQGAEGGPSENRVPELTKAVDRYIMAMARFNLACSARFNDVQHTSPQTVRSTSNTLELLAWQTKTTSAVAIKRNPVPLIAPLFSFSGARWWIPLEKWWKRFRASEEFREMDYLIPTINKDRTGFIPRPGTPDRSLRWLKDALGKQGAPAKDVAEPGEGDGAEGVGLRPQQQPLHGGDLPADRGPYVPGGSRGSTIHGSGGTCDSGTRAAHARGHCPKSHGLVRTGTAGEGLGGEDQTHQTQVGPARKRPADEAPVQTLRWRRDRIHPHEVPGKRTPGTRRTAMEDRQEDHG